MSGKFQLDEHHIDISEDISHNYLKLKALDYILR